MDALEAVANSESTYAGVVRMIYQGIKVGALDALRQQKNKALEIPKDAAGQEQKIANYERVIKEIKKQLNCYK